MKRVLGIVLLSVSLAIKVVYATEGWIEIDQATLETTSQGTLVIDRPGSYRLISDLSQRGFASIIYVDSAEVKLDLNGYTLVGPAECSVFPGESVSVACSATGRGYGVEINPITAHQVSISNGAIVGIAGGGVLGGKDTHLEELVINHCGGDGLRLAGGFVRRVTSIQNQGADMVLNDVMLTKVVASSLFSHTAIDPDLARER